jgi:hypothetical protein
MNIHWYHDVHGQRRGNLKTRTMGALCQRVMGMYHGARPPPSRSKYILRETLTAPEPLGDAMGNCIASHFLSYFHDVGRRLSQGTHDASPRSLIASTRRVNPKSQELRTPTP